MSEASQPTPEELAQQARQHLASLQAAGVEWLPKGAVQSVQPTLQTPVEPPQPVASSRAPKEVSQPAASLFAELAPAEPVAAAPLPTLTLEQRRVELQVLAERVAGCRRCAGLAISRSQTVFGVGPLSPELCFVGEAPGADEDAQGEPFVGAAGQLLDRIIAACGMKREEVYICNIIKCRPPQNRQPLPDEAANCREYLERQLELVQPKFICALGRTPATYLLGSTQSLAKLRGRFYSYRGIPVMCTYHPAFLLPHRSPEKKKDVWEDMKWLMEQMGRKIPGKK